MDFPFDGSAGTIDAVPAKLRALDGRRVAVTGFMFAATKADDKPNANRYHLVYNVLGRDGRGPPLVQARVFVTASADLPIYDMTTLVTVTGTFHVRLERSAGSDGSVITQVFGLTADRVVRAEDSPDALP